MLKVKNIFVIVVINIFVYCVISMCQEYINLGTTISQVSTTIDSCVRSASRTAMLSEELFGSGSSNITSKATVNDYGTAVYFRNGQWVRANPYLLGAIIADSANSDVYDLPDSQSVISNMESVYTIPKMYKLFYGYEDAYLSSSLSWLGLNGKPYLGYSESSILRKPTSRFKEFAEGVTRLNSVAFGTNATNLGMWSKTFMRQRVGDGWIGVEYYIPTLAKMGLKLYMGTTPDAITGYYYGGNNSSSSVLNQDTVTVSHIGKRGSLYYYTPNSLGVTYLVPEVLKATFLANLDAKVRFNKTRAGTLDDETLKASWASATGCIDTSVYPAGATSPNAHTYTGGGSLVDGSTSIINDGRIEYDLDSVKAKVDYYVVDLNKNRVLLDEVTGVVSGDKSWDSYILKGTDGAVDSDYTRVVARVSFKIKLHIPYTSSIMQLFASSVSGENHYDIPLIDPLNNITLDSESGVWYKSTQYVAVLT